MRAAEVTRVKLSPILRGGGLEFINSDAGDNTAFDCVKVLKEERRRKGDTIRVEEGRALIMEKSKTVPQMRETVSGICLRPICLLLIVSMYAY